MKKKYMIIFGIIIVLLILIPIVYATNYLFISNEVGYDNSNVASSNVQDTIKEIYDSKIDGCYVGYTRGAVTSDTYLCNKSSANANQTYVIDSGNVNFDNAGTNLSSTNVKDSLDEIVGKIPYCTYGYDKYNATNNSYECKVNMYLSDTSGDVSCGGTSTIEVLGYHNGTLSCTSSDTSIATCSVSGTTIIVSGVSEGSAELTMTRAATANNNTVTRTYIVTVRDWHYVNNYYTANMCSSDNYCPKICQASYNTSMWSCTSSNSIAPSGPSLTSGGRCWCYY